MKPKHYKIAEYHEGLKEWKGAGRHNPEIISFSRELGHSWVETDEVPWCAAFVGACLEEAGLRSTRKLNARSYTSWGKKVWGEPRIGDVCVFKRGNSKWQGHVAFYAGKKGNSILCLGGNQDNMVKVSRYSRKRLITVRRADHEPEPDEPLELDEPKNLPPEEREPLGDSWTMKGGIFSLFSAIIALIEGLKTLHPVTQILLVFIIVGVSTVLYRRWDANRKGKQG